MLIRMKDHTGREVLAGARSGKSALNWMLEQTIMEPARPELAILDFSAVEVATASFLRESVLAFRDIIRGRRSQFYPIAANMNDLVRDEFIELLRARGGAIMTCSNCDDGHVRDPTPIGQLDPKQRLTYELVQRHGETDASELMREYGRTEGLKHTTAWNNRLAALASMGLIVEESEGRAKRYRLLVERT